MGSGCATCNGPLLDPPLERDGEQVCDSCADTIDAIDAMPTHEGSRIRGLRKIVDTRTAGKIDGQVVDLFTASMLVTVHDALSPESQAKFDKPDLMRLIDFGWSNVRRA